MRKYILFLIAASSSFFANAQSDSVGEALDIGNNQEFGGYEVLDSALVKYQLFLAGEDYEYASFNSKMEFKLLRYMNHKVGLRNYLLETSAAKANLINQYINEPDSTTEKLLQSVSKIKYMRLYKNLKRLNKKLPDSLKIRVFGIDVERTNALPLVKMSQYLRTDSVPDELRIVVEAITGAAKFIISQGLEDYENERDGTTSDFEDYFYTPTAFSVRLSVNEFMKIYDSLHTKFESWLGPKYAGFNEAVGWLKEYETWVQYRKTAFEYSWREETMFKRMNALLAEHPGEKFFGQLSLCRTCNQRVPEGCGAYNFSGLVNKLRTYPESNGKQLVNIGIFYTAELDKDESDMSKIHKPYTEELESLKKHAPDNAAVLMNLNKFDAPLLHKDYDFLLLNNDYKLYEEELEEGDSTVSDYFSNYFLEDYRNSRMYVGVLRFDPMLDLKNVNSALSAGGLPTIGNVRVTGGELSFATEDHTLIRLTGGASFSDSGNYKNMAFLMEIGQALLYKKFIKVGFGYRMGYIQHTITQFSTSNSQTYITNYEAPKVYKNPAFIVGLGASVYLDLAPFYIYAGGGRHWDPSRRSWRLDGKSTGSGGGLSNTGWYLNYGFGFSIPIRWID